MEATQLMWYKVTFTAESKRNPDYGKCLKLAREYGNYDRRDGSYEILAQGSKVGIVERIAGCGAAVTEAGSA